MSNWFRFYDDAVNDPKIIDLPDELFRAWVNLLCIAAKNDGVLPEIKHIALVLRVKVPKAAALITKLVGLELVDNHAGVFAPHNWQGRQFKSDDSGPRVKRHREKLRNIKRNSNCNVTGEPEGNAPEQAEKKVDGEQSRADAGTPIDLDLGRRVAGLSLQIEAHFRAYGQTVPKLDRCETWLNLGYQPSIVSQSVEAVLKRGKPIATLDYFDGAIKDAHKSAPPPAATPVPLTDQDWDATVKRWKQNQSYWPRAAGGEPGMGGCRCPAKVLADNLVNPSTGQPMTSDWVFVIEGTPEGNAHRSNEQERRWRPVPAIEIEVDGVSRMGVYRSVLIPPGYDEATGERIARPENEENAA